jgi:hypothetical protein
MLRKYSKIKEQKEDAFFNSEFSSSLQGHAYLKASHFTEIQEYKTFHSLS